MWKYDVLVVSLPAVPVAATETRRLDANDHAVRRRARVGDLGQRRAFAEVIVQDRFQVLVSCGYARQFAGFVFPSESDCTCQAPLISANCRVRLIAESLPVRVSTVCNFDYENRQYRIGDFIDDPVVSDPYPIILTCRKLLAADRSRISGQRGNRGHDAPPLFLRSDCLQFFLRRSFNADLIIRHVPSVS